MTTRESILQRLAALLAATPATFPRPSIDEPEPVAWAEVPGKPRLSHAIMVMDGAPPEVLGFVRGAEADPTDELELEAAIGYAVQARQEAGQDLAHTRAARRAQRDAVVRAVADLIAQNRNLGLGVEVWAEVGAVARDDDVAFPNAQPCATALIPVRVLYTGVDAAA